MDDGYIEAQWVIDSESGIRYLIDVKTGRVLMVYSDWEDDNGY